MKTTQIEIEENSDRLFLFAFMRVHSRRSQKDYGSLSATYSKNPVIRGPSHVFSSQEKQK
jgi:hypothetical protein